MTSARKPKDVVRALMANGLSCVNAGWSRKQLLGAAAIERLNGALATNWVSA